MVVLMMIMAAMVKLVLLRLVEISWYLGICSEPGNSKYVHISTTIPIQAAVPDRQSRSLSLCVDGAAIVSCCVVRRIGADLSTSSH